MSVVSIVVRCASAAWILLNGSDTHYFYSFYVLLIVTMDLIGIFQLSHLMCFGISYNLPINSKYCAYTLRIPDVSYIGMHHIRIGIFLWQITVFPGELSKNRHRCARNRRKQNRNSNFFRSEYEKHMLHMIVLDKNEFVHISNQKTGESYVL